MASVDDAIELVTSLKYAAPLGRSTDDPVEMQAGAIVSALVALGADDEIAARILAMEAAERLGGASAIAQQPGGNRAGGPVVRSRLRLWIPRDELHD
jgi:hypothetical protein